jgi:hypothetical protein
MPDPDTEHYQKFIVMLTMLSEGLCPDCSGSVDSDGYHVSKTCAPCWLHVCRRGDNPDKDWYVVWSLDMKGLPDCSYCGFRKGHHVR